MLQNIKISPAPHISKHYSTSLIMLNVLIGLLPAFIAAVWYFRAKAVMLTLVCVAACCLAEWLCNLARSKPNSLGDLSAAITGVILAFSVPPALPWWTAIIGSIFAIAVGKMVFGGLGANVFNPAMIGRAFLTASFGMMMTTWTVPATIDKSMPEISVKNTSAITQATPLAWSKQAIKSKGEDVSKKVDASIANNMLKDLFFGQRGGCLGETSSIALIIGGIYLLLTGTISIHIPLAVLLSAFAASSIGYFMDSTAYASPVFHLMSGGMLIGAFFIATDPVTSPLTKKGMWIFGIGVGGLTMLIRIVGEYPEGMMFSILLMNSITPLIDRLCKIIPAGGTKNA
ncbi:MAG: RnfABCDGE type electron transport complex subunit D [Sedimentisphaerales bacterium]